MRAVECSDARERIVPNRSNCSRECLASTATSAWDQEAVLYELQEGVSNSAMRWPERVCFSAWVGVSEMSLLWLAWRTWALVSAVYTKRIDFARAAVGVFAGQPGAQKTWACTREVGACSGGSERGGWDGDERGRRPSARPWAARNGKMEVSTRASLRRTIKPAPRTNSGDYLILLLLRQDLRCVLACLAPSDRRFVSPLHS